MINELAKSHSSKEHFATHYRYDKTLLFKDTEGSVYLLGGELEELLRSIAIHKNLTAWAPIILREYENTIKIACGPGVMWSISYDPEIETATGSFHSWLLDRI